jgi:tRNA threonylcarbamoyladenosine biosynthesis protein TsaB
MKVLALELSTTRASLAWLDDEARQTPGVNRATGGDGLSLSSFATEWPNDRKNSGLFFENLQRTIKKFGLPEVIVVGLGPGSYAGTRIAISAAVGLQAAAHGRLIGYPSVCTIEGIDDYVMVGDARRQSFYCARVRERKRVDDFRLFRENELDEKINRLHSSVPVVSSDLLPQFARVQRLFPSAKVLAELACAEQPNFFVSPLEPIYLREPHVTTPKPMTPAEP